MMKKGTSANLYPKCLILGSKILQEVLHKMSLTFLLTMATLILDAFLANLGVLCLVH